MLRIIWTVAALGLCAACAAAAPGADYYVAPGGNDAWSGKLPAPSRDGSDGPFATVGRAQQAARVLRQARGSRAQSVVVMLRGGTYVLDHALAFTPRDSGGRRAARPSTRPIRVRSRR